MKRWKSWFAWRPVRLSTGAWRWLTVIERRYAGGEDHGYWLPEYRDP